MGIMNYRFNGNLTEILFDGSRGLFLRKEENKTSDRENRLGSAVHPDLYDATSTPLAGALDVLGIDATAT